MVLGRGVRRVLGGGVVVLGLVSSAPAQVAGPIAISGRSPFLPSCTVPGAVVGTEVEPMVAVNPTDHRNIIAVWQQDRFAGGGSRSNVVGASLDGGATWRTVLLLGVSRCTGGTEGRASDPWVTFGPDGIAYVSSIAFDSVIEGTAVLVCRSRDKGLTWSNPVTVAEDVDLFLNDKETITADPTAPGYAYAVWAQFESNTMPGVPVVAFSRTTDGGTTWSMPVPIYLVPGSAVQGNEIVVLPDGALLNLFVELGGGLITGTASSGGYRIGTIRSDDKGRTWSLPTTIGTLSARSVVDPDNKKTVRTAAFLVSSDVGPDGSIYVVWQDVQSTTHGEIRFSRSTDGGRSWSFQVPLATVPAQAFTPTVAVTADGTVGVIFYDFRSDRPGDGPLSTDLWFRSSADGGETWAEQHVAGPFDMRRAPDSNGLFLGDYEGLAVVGSRFGAVFAHSVAGEAVATDIFWAGITP